MACLASSGQRHLALEQYQRMARTLWRTYRIGPSAESTALYEAIRHPGPYRSPP
jgi:SARP family transcriptional regulator, regulator of embCAB operon